MKHNCNIFCLYIILIIFTSLYVLSLLWNDRKYVEYDSDESMSSYYQNHEWMFNANVFQYSSYLIALNASHYQIEILIFVFTSPPKDSHVNYFECFVQTIKKSELLRVRVITTHKLVVDNIYKVVCLLEEKLILKDAEDFAVAVVVKADFQAKENLNSTSFPLSMMNFQIPSIIQAEYPRLKKVGICLNFVSKTHQGIFNWVQMQELFEANNVVMHDGSHNSLRNLIYPKFNPNFVEIRDYNIDENSICNTDLIKAKTDANPNNALRYKNICSQFLRTVFKEYGNHNHLSVNDCYASFYYRYEFVALYDLDELIVPRAHNLLDISKSNQIFECRNLSQVCSYKPVLKMYDYIKDLITNEFKHNISKLRSIAFHHSVFLIPTTNVQNLLMENLKIIVDQIKTNHSNVYPFILNTGGNYSFHHSFIINELDKEYAVHLSHAYDEIKCLFDKFLANTTLEHQWKRYVYFHTHYDQRFPKSIHYTQNVQGLFTHDAAHFTKDSIILNPTKENGHMNSHYRENINGFLSVKKSSSIKNIGIDYDYVLFLLKNFTPVCFI